MACRYCFVDPPEASSVAAEFAPRVFSISVRDGMSERVNLAVALAVVEAARRKAEKIGVPMNI